MAEVSHPHILRFVGVCSIPPAIITGGRLQQSPHHHRQLGDTWQRLWLFLGGVVDRVDSRCHMSTAQKSPPPHTLSTTLSL